MKNEIIHGKILSVKDMIGYEEEYSRSRYFFFGLKKTNLC